MSEIFSIGIGLIMIFSSELVVLEPDPPCKDEDESFHGPEMTFQLLKSSNELELPREIKADSPAVVFELFVPELSPTHNKTL
jgi:hypothetical protein